MIQCQDGFAGKRLWAAYDVFYQVLTRLDSEAFAALLTDWWQHHHGQWPAALAMDGKMIRDHIGLLTLAQHEDGAPQALAVYDQKENTPRCEQTTAAALLARLPALDGKIVTADPLHSQRKTARVIVEKGGDYLVQLEIRSSKSEIRKKSEARSPKAHRPVPVRSARFPPKARSPVRPSDFGIQVQIKGNQPRLLAQAQQFDARKDTPFLPTPKAATGG